MVGSDTTELSQRLALVRPVHTVRGLGFNAILGLVAERVGKEAEARLAQELSSERLVDFFSYPASDFMRLLFSAADLLAPQLGSQQEAIRACGAACLNRFFYSSTVGRALAKMMAGKSPMRGFTSAPLAYSALVNYGTHECEVLGPRQVRLHFRGDMQPPLFHEGTLAAALEVVGAKGKVAATVHSLEQVDYLIEWEE